MSKSLLAFAFLAIAVLALSSTHVRSADRDPAAIFDELFASKINAARRTLTFDDDVAVAKELVSSVSVLQEYPDVLKRVFITAVELSSRKMAGYGVAIDATIQWEKQFPDQRLEVMEQRVQVRQKIYRTAKVSERSVAAESLLDDQMVLARLHFSGLDLAQASRHARSALIVAKQIRSDRQQAITEFIAAIPVRAKEAAKINRLKKQLKDNPQDESAGREIVLMYLLDFENPSEAEKYVAQLKDENLKTFVRTSSTPASDLSADDALASGEVYFQLAKEPSRAKPVELYEQALARFYQYRSEKPEDRTLRAAKASARIYSIEKWLEAHYAKSRDLPAELKKGLAVHLSFNRSERDMVSDTSGQKKHGKVVGAKWVRDGRGKGNGVYELDGKVGLIQLHPSTLGNWTALTYSIWVKAPPVADSNWPSFIGSHTSDSGFNHSIGFWQGSRTFRLEIDTDAGNFANQGKHVAPVNKWFHVAMVYDGKAVREYLNGVEGASFPASGRLKQVGALSLGQDHPMYALFLGQLDDAMIYNRALTAKQIKQLYDLQRSRSSLNKLGKPMAEHMDRITPHLLMDGFENDQGREGINGWRKNANGNAGLPVVLVNASDKDLAIPQTALAGSVMTHPPSAGGAGIAWQSPSTGTFRIKGSVADAHAGGNSVSWKLQSLHAKGHTTLASGSVEPQGTSQFVTETSTKALASIRLKAGEMIQLVVLPKGDYSSDLSRVDWSITEVGGRGRAWNLAKDIVPDLLEEGKGNPHSDSHGNKDVWYFYEVPPDKLLE